MLRIRTGRQVGVLWAVAIALFVLFARISIALSPETPPDQPPEAPPASYYAGLVGLLAIGVALALTWAWERRSESLDEGVRLGVQFALVIGAVLWLLAMVFPFL